MGQVSQIYQKYLAFCEEQGIREGEIVSPVVSKYLGIYRIGYFRIFIY